MRYWRLIGGAFLVLAVLWVIVGEQMAGASADAVVNAELATVRAPIAGEVSMPSLPLGVTVAAGEEIGTISDPLADRLRQNDLEMEHAFAVAALDRTTAELGAVEAQRAAVQARLDDYATTRIAEIEVRLTEARARAQQLGAGAEPDAIDAVLERGQPDDPGDPSRPGIALSYARERVETLEIALASARRGVFIGDGYNDAPFAGQFLTQLDARIAALETQAAEAEARRDAIAGRLDDERVRTSRLGTAVLTAPVSGIVWERLIGDGEVAQRGQDILRVLDCDSSLVTLSVTEGVYNRLTVGSDARFRMTGADEVMQGTVVRLAGSGAATVYRNLAVAPGPRHLERYDVMLLVPALRADPALACAVGRTGRAFFDTRPLDGIRALFD